jgi:hypothetical protein
MNLNWIEIGLMIATVFAGMISGQVVPQMRDAGKVPAGLAILIVVLGAAATLVWFLHPRPISTVDWVFLVGALIVGFFLGVRQRAGEAS